jgi:hypothetical protein
MPQTQVQVQREYRARKRAQMGDVEFRRVEAEKRKARRERNRPPPVPPTPQSIEEEKESEPAGMAEIKEIIRILNQYLNKEHKLDLPTIANMIKEKAIPALVKLEENKGCESLFEAVFAARSKIVETETPGKKNPRKLKKSQFKKYQWSNMINLYKQIHNTNTYDCENLDWLKDTQKVIDFIKNKYPKENTVISKTSNLASITSVLDGFKEAYKVYSKISTEGRIEKTKIDDNALLTDKEKINILPWDKLKKLYKNKKLSLKTRAIIGLYTTIPPRRLELGGLLTIAYDEGDLDEDFNWLIIDNETKNPKKIVMLKYKTEKMYGRYEIELENKLYKKILKDYIIENDLKEGDPVFGTAKGSYYSSFTPVLSGQFKTATKKNISVNLLRHAYISDFLKKKRTPAERKALAKQMGHDVGTQIMYERVDLKYLDKIDD